MKIIMSDNRYIKKTLSYCSGPICVKFENGKNFPSDDWSDFLIVIITEWLRTVLENENKNLADFRLSFMDGPYEILCSKNMDVVSIITLTAYKTTAIEEHLKFSDLKNAVIEAANALISEANAIEYRAEELKQLEELMQTIRQ